MKIDNTGYRKYLENYHNFQRSNEMYSKPFTKLEYNQMAKEMRMSGSKNAPRDVASMQKSFTEREANIIGKALGMKKSDVKKFSDLEYEYEGEKKIAKTARQAAFIRAKYASGDDFDVAEAIYKSEGGIKKGQTYDEWKAEKKILLEADKKAKKINRGE